MGRSYTPVYRVEMRLPGYEVTAMTWSFGTYGKPTDDNLAKLVEAWDSVGMGEGLPMISWAKIVDQLNGNVVASYSAPMFKAV